jgi:hypothetical protein
MKDDADRLKDGTLPTDPSADVEEMPKPAKSENSLRPLAAIFDEALRRVEARKSGEERPVPLPWPDMAPQFGGGLWPGVHVLVAGTGAGKTAWALQVALHAAKAGIPVGYVGLELEDTQIAVRILAEETNQAWSSLYLGQANQTAIEASKHAAKDLSALPFYVEVGRPTGWPVSELAGIVEKMRARHPIHNGARTPMLLILDFLQICGDEMRPDGRPVGLDMRERIGRAAYAARDIARRHDVAVLLISSAARDKYDLLSNLSSSAGLVAEADMANGKRVLDATGRPIVRRRKVLAPDQYVGLGKESGEIEYAADSVTVACRYAFEGTAGSSVVFVTAKGRATGPSWSELRFNGHAFSEAPSRGLDVVDDLALRAEAKERKNSKPTVSPRDQRYIDMTKKP